MKSAVNQCSGITGERCGRRAEHIAGRSVCQLQNEMSFDGSKEDANNG